MDIVILIQDALETAWNIYNHFDFIDIQFAQYFYLDPTYPNNIVPFKQFPKHKLNLMMTKTYWLICEMRARAAYYQQAFKHRSNIHFHKVNLDDLTQKSAIKIFFEQLGLSPKQITMLEKETPMQKQFFPGTEKQVMETLINQIIIDPEQMGLDYFRLGKKIG